MDFIHQSLQESLGILHTYLRPQILSSDESPEFVEKLKQTVRPLANIAAYNSQFKGRLSPTFANRKRAILAWKSELMYCNLENSHARFVYLSYSKSNEKWNVVHAIERLVYVLETHHFHTGIEIVNTTTNRENDS